jgi:hypothetical protein
MNRTQQRTAVVVFVAMSMLGGCTAAPPQSVSVSHAECLAQLDLQAPQGSDDPSVTPPKVIRRAEPIPSASMIGSVRSATVDVAVGIDGLPGVICFVEGNRAWASVFASALRDWRFEPATRNGTPVAMRVRLTSTLR